MESRSNAFMFSETAITVLDIVGTAYTLMN